MLIKTIIQVKNGNVLRIQSFANLSQRSVFSYISKLKTVKIKRKIFNTPGLNLVKIDFHHSYLSSSSAPTYELLFIEPLLCSMQHLI